MTALPAGWRIAQLGEVADTTLGKMLDRGHPRGLATVPYLRNVNVQWGRIDTHDLLNMELADGDRERFAVQPGDLLVCEGGEIGRAAIWHGRTEYLAFQKALHRIRSRGNLNLSYLRYLLELYHDDGTLERFATGSTIAHLPQQKLRMLPVPLPPLEEQRRIVDVLEDHLSRLDAAESSLTSALVRLRVLHKSVLMHLIPDVSAYPAHWSKSTVSDAGKVTLGRQRHPDWHNGANMHPYLRVANVFEDRIDLCDVKEMHWPGDSFERFRLKPGDVLLNEGQSPEFLGRPALYSGEHADIAFTNTLIRFQANDHVLPEFALLVFRRHMHAGRFARESRITTNIAHLSASRLKPIEFPIPPLDEQKHLAGLAEQQLGDAARLGDQIHLHKLKSSVLRRALLGAAFSGRLTGRSSDLELAEELSVTAI